MDDDYQAFSSGLTYANFSIPRYIEDPSYKTKWISTILPLLGVTSKSKVKTKVSLEMYTEIINMPAKKLTRNDIRSIIEKACEIFSLPIEDLPKE
jgi:hypothetical protein